MATENISLLLTTAASIGFIHTLAGPDHYLPFVAMSKTGNWSKIKTAYIVIIAGLLHVLSSIAIGFFGLMLGKSAEHLGIIESFRGDIAAWLLFIFGAGYLIWAIIRIIIHGAHSHSNLSNKQKFSYWMLFAVFVFGPCEPLIPILMYPAAEHNYLTVALVSTVFAMVTIGTMLVITFSLLSGIKFIKFTFIEKYNHVIAGLILMMCGAAILFLGL